MATAIQAKHTPGPWKGYRDPHDVEAGAHNPDIYVSADNWGDIATIGGGPLETREANARLIAAAPDLLAAAEYCVQFCDADISQTLRKRLRAAIEKATVR